MLFNSIKLILLNLIILINLNRSATAYEWHPFACDGTHDTEILTSTLRHVVIHFNDLYFFFESYVILIEAPKILENLKKNASSLELKNIFIIGEPEIAYYNNMISLPNIMEERFDNYTVFQFFESHQIKDKETYMVYTKKSYAFLFETGPDFNMSGKLTEKDNWVWKYAELKENQVGFNHFQDSR